MVSDPPVKTDNPLLSREYRIPFDRIRPEHVVPGVRAALAAAEIELAALAGDDGDRTYEDTVQRLDDLVERLDRVVGPVSHLVGAMNTPELREAYNTVLPEFSAFYAKLPLDSRVRSALREFAATPEAEDLDPVRRRHVEKLLLEFTRAGADLDPGRKQRVEQIRVELSQLHSDFSDNALDATNAWALHVTDSDDLAGLPDSAVARARVNARDKGDNGWRFTLQLPSYQPFMQYAENRDLRREMYEHFMNRAAEAPFDNRPLIGRILELRRELADLLGYRDFADYAVELNMARSGERAFGFVTDLTRRTREHWVRETEMLAKFARDELGLDRLEPWDTAFVGERMRRRLYDVDDEELRPFFPLDRVVSGMFEIARRLFGVVVSERSIDEVWHPDVRFYEVRDEEGEHLGSFYADWFPRESKRAGAWMMDLITGGPREDGFRPHLGLVVANFSPPEGERPALLTHKEVETTFHEFGHLLHHLLSRVPVAARAGTNVPRDWVELPSQIMENWVWEREALDLFARHYETGAAIPGELYEKMVAARRFLAASHQMRQLSMGTVDLDLHIRYRPERDGDPIRYTQQLMEEFAIRPEFAHNHFVTSFSHVFAGGYAAGYYSYLWSEVLDADAFGRFAEAGIFDRRTGREYVEAILSRGDGADPAELFREFRGRDPDPEALLRRNLGVGLESAAA